MEAPGRGKPKRRKSAKTLDKETARERLRQYEYAELEPLIQAQIANALGISHFFLRNKAGQFERVTDQTQIEAAINAGEPGSHLPH